VTIPYIMFSNGRGNLRLHLGSSAPIRTPRHSRIHPMPLANSGTSGLALTPPDWSAPVRSAVALCGAKTFGAAPFSGGKAYE
jgi:hypothetical protein